MPQNKLAKIFPGAINQFSTVSEYKIVHAKIFIVTQLVQVPKTTITKRKRVTME